MSTSLHHIPATPESLLPLLKALSAYLPYCLPVYRRIQFGNSSPRARIVCSLSPEELRDLAATSSSLGSSSSDEPERPSRHWLVAFIDRAKRPETEGWMFGTWDATEQYTEDDNDHDGWKKAAKPLLAALLHEANQVLPAPSVSGTGDSAPVSTTNGAGGDGLIKDHPNWYMLDPSVCLIGAVHENTAHVLAEMGAVVKGFEIAPKIANYKWVFDLSSPTTLPQSEGSASTAHIGLPAGYFFRDIKAVHYDFIRSRAMFPSSDATLKLLPSVGAYAGDPLADPTLRPIGWTFVGADGSLRTLNVEPEHRRKGIAQAMCREAWRTKYGAFSVSGEGVGDSWSHSDVLIGNDASNAMMKGLGGRRLHQNYWVRMDLTKA